MDPAALLLAGAALELGDERLVAVARATQRGVDLVEVGEVVQAVGAGAQLAGRLRAAQQEQGDDRSLAVVEVSRSSSTWRYFVARAPLPACTMRARPWPSAGRWRERPRAPPTSITGSRPDVWLHAERSALRVSG